MGYNAADVVRLARPKGKNVADKMIDFRSAEEGVSFINLQKARMDIFYHAKKLVATFL
jgi:hypothetical protein